MSDYKKRMEALEKRFSVLTFEKDGEVCFMGKGLIVTYDGFEKLQSQLLKTKGQLEKAEAVIKKLHEFDGNFGMEEIIELANKSGEYFKEKEEGK